MGFKPYKHKSCARKRFFLKREAKRLDARLTRLRKIMMVGAIGYENTIHERDGLLEASEAKIAKLESKMADANKTTRQLEEAMANLKLKDQQLEAKNVEIAQLQKETVSADDLQKFEDQLTANESEIEAMRNQMVGAIGLKDRQLEKAMAKLSLKDQQLKAKNNEIAQLRGSLMAYEDELEESSKKSNGQQTANNIKAGQSLSLMADASEVQSQLAEKDAKIKSLEEKLSTSQRNNESLIEQTFEAECRLNTVLKGKDKFIERMRQLEQENQQLKAQLEQTQMEQAGPKNRQSHPDHGYGSKIFDSDSDDDSDNDSDNGSDAPTASGDSNIKRFVTLSDFDAMGNMFELFDDSAMEETSTLSAQQAQEETDRQLAMMLAYDESGGTDFDMEDDGSSDRGYDSNQFDDLAMEETSTLSAQQAQEEADHQLATSLTHDESYDADFDMEDTPDASNDKIYDANYYKEQCRVLQDIFNESIGEIWELKAQLEQANSEINKLKIHSDHGYGLSILGNGSSDADVGNSDHGYDSLKALKTAYDAAMEENKNMADILKALSRHCVYGFFTAKKQLLYAGQTINFAGRIVNYHFGIATGKVDQSKAKPFHAALKTEMVKGVYVVKLFEGLNELKANDIEKCLILKLKELGSGANVEHGRWTVRFRMLGDIERKLEIDRVYAEAMLKIQDISEDKLVTHDKPLVLDDNELNKCVCGTAVQKGLLTCRKCHYVTQNDVECKRDQCFTLGVGSNGYCYSCYANNWVAISDGKILPTKRLSTNYIGAKKNSLPRALVLSMQKLGGREILRKVSTLFPRVKMTNQTNVDKWIREKIKKVKSARDLANFLKADENSYAGLQENIVDHLIVREHSTKRSAEEASERLTKLFYCPEDEGKFSLAIVQEKFANIEAIKSVICQPIEQPTPEDNASDDENIEKNDQLS